MCETKRGGLRQMADNEARRDALSIMTHHQFLDKISCYRDEIITCAREAIAIPSMTGSEGKLVDYFFGRMEEAKCTGVRIDSMGNLIGRIGRGKTVIMIDAHLDTVGIGKREEWKWDPFEGKLEDDAIWGRGATDQKLAMVSMIYAVRLIMDTGLLGDYSLYLVGSCEEENCEGYALNHIIEHEKIMPDFVVITEPTNLKLCRGQRGRVKIRISTTGRSCHASTPEHGDNAISKMSPIIRDVEALNTRLPDDPFLGRGTVAVTSIGCETPSQNAIPSECRICLDRRLTRGETCDSALKEIRALPSVIETGALVDLYTHRALSWRGFEIRQEEFFPSWILPEDHDFLKAASRAGECATGEIPQVGRWRFSTNGVATAGKWGIPTIGFGPSDEQFAHTVDEHTPVDHLLKAAIFYAALPAFIATMQTCQRRGSYDTAASGRD
jgi:putative selenium metabolism hydrolase